MWWGLLQPCALLLLCVASVTHASARAILPHDGRVLVLGSDGLIGTGVTQWLHSHGYETELVRNRRHHDLRIKGSLNGFYNISFVYFLACEVGGAKYIDSKGNAQLDIIQNNLLIYQNVFPWLAEHAIPFVFTSSYLQAQPTSYGSIKRLGESWINTMSSHGRMVRLWNIYGPEKLGPRAHVLTDWINACLTRREIASMTDGLEARQFLHVDDTANALGLIMTHWDTVEPITDLSSGEWVTMRTIAHTISSSLPLALLAAGHGADASNVTCQATFANVKAVARTRLAPNLGTLFHHHWHPTVSLSEGILRMFAHYQQSTHQQSQSQSQSQIQTHTQTHTQLDQLVSVTVTVPSSPVSSPSSSSASTSSSDSSPSDAAALDVMSNQTSTPSATTSTSTSTSTSTTAEAASTVTTSTTSPL